MTTAVTATEIAAAPRVQHVPGLAASADGRVGFRSNLGLFNTTATTTNGYGQIVFAARNDPLIVDRKRGLPDCPLVTGQFHQLIAGFNIPDSGCLVARRSQHTASIV